MNIQRARHFAGPVYFYPGFPGFLSMEPARPLAIDLFSDTGMLKFSVATSPVYR
ncbi:MAG: hypothetical protein GY737_14215 [Desulfobacteraceae bacterium]|nr:hypothetical protein [Desulfobacteraceae bacterium]